MSMRRCSLAAASSPTAWDPLHGSKRYARGRPGSQRIKRPCARRSAADGGFSGQGASRMASKKAGHPWAFRARFHANAFGWKSQPAIARVREAVAEIKKVAKSDPLVAAEGAVLFLE